MSYELVKDEIKRFLKSPEPEVLVLRGKWGVGKTYAWNEILKEAANSEDKVAISKTRYSYLSLFGIQSLDALKYALFQQSISRRRIGEQPSYESLRENVDEIAHSGGKGLAELGKLFRFSMPGIGSFSLPSQELSFFSLRDTLICLDDLERISGSLTPRQVLGLVSMLKEQRNCKAVLLLNDDAEGMEEFTQAREKVADIELLFSPTGKECADIAFSDSEDFVQQIGKCSFQLDITNIRTLKKIERIVRLVHERITSLGLDTKLIGEAIEAIVLFSWSHFHVAEDGVPPLEYLLGYRETLIRRVVDEGTESETETPEPEATWITYLTAYGFQGCDEFEEALAKIVTTGYIEGDWFDSVATARSRRIQIEKSTGRIKDVWELYDDTFENNGDELAEKVMKVHRACMEFAHARQIDDAIWILRELGRDTDADLLINKYVELHAENPHALSTHSRTREIRDTKFSEAMQHARNKIDFSIPTHELLEQLAKGVGLSNKEEKMLSDRSADDFFEFFSTADGYAATQAAHQCLDFQRIANINAEKEAIVRQATDALKRVAQQSKINRIRVRHIFGIDLDDSIATAEIETIEEK